MNLEQIVAELRRINEAANGRELTTAEQTRWDELSRQAETIKAATTRAAAVEALSATAPVAGANRMTPGDCCTPLGYTGTGTESRGKTTKIMTPSGRELRSFGPAEPMADDEYRSRMADRGVNLDNVSIGRIIAAAVTRRADALTDDEQRVLRDQTTVSNTGGGYLVPESLHPVVYDLARAKSCYLQAGARVIQMGSEAETIVTVQADPTVECKPELDAFTGSSVVFGAGTLVSQTCGQTILMSRELIQDSANAAAEIEGVLARVIAQTVDYYCIQGSGSGEPSGMINKPGVNTPGAVADYEDMLDRLATLEALNYTPNAYLVGPVLNNTLRKERLDEGAGAWLSIPPEVAGMRRLVSTGVPSGTLILGEWQHAVLGVRMGVEISADDRGDRFDRYAVQLRAVTRIAPGLIRPNAFAVCASE